LALAQYHLNRIQEAISNLKAAKATCNPLDDLRLYLDVLSQLQRFYFEQKNYLEAYEIKQKQRSVEQQFGLRAFIGAGRLESQHQEILAQAQAEVRGTIAPEIVASGRQRDVEQLVERIAKNETKLIVIHGQSGVGKSSLVNAGLIPALQGKQIGIQTVVAVPIRVYTNWGEELGRLLAEKREENGIDDTSTTSPVNPDSTAAILEQLHQNDQLNRRTVLIFDQFEEFFFACHSVERQKFFEFLRECLQILSVKVVLSLREDYLHYLLECDRLLSRGITSHGILSEDVLYPLNNFSSDEAQHLIEQLTERGNFHLESGLIDKLVDDLASKLDGVRPIELQVVGAQLQAEQINTLAQYQAYGSKEELVQRYLAEVVADCGEENQQVANLVLYLLTDEKETRPLKTCADLDRELTALAADTSQLDLVLAILVKSGLVFELPEIPAERYQLVHDYLAGFIRRQQEPKLNRLKAQLEQEQQQREKAETLSRLSQKELAQVKRKARQQVLVGTTILAVTLIASAGVLASKDRTIRLLQAQILEPLLAQGCTWLRDYLATNPNVKESDKRLCEEIDTQK
jgi:DNA replication protein DnaC/AcrR family transcriptional regulator